MGTHKLQIKQAAADLPDPFDPSEVLLNYLAESTARLDRKNRDGLPQSEIIAAAQMLEDVVNKGERETLLAQLEPLHRRNLLRNVARFANLTVNINDQKMSFGDNATVSGTINQVAAAQIKET